MAWTWARAEFALPEPALDVLVVDEAGQMSLANVVACAPAARTIVLLGDPQQLDQPTQGSHPPGAERSALSHLLADPTYLRPDRPDDPARGGAVPRADLAAPPGRLRVHVGCLLRRPARPVDGLERQRYRRQTVGTPGPVGGTGMRYLPVDHAGNATDSDEEAQAIAAIVLGPRQRRDQWIDRDGVAHR